MEIKIKLALLAQDTCKKGELKGFRSESEVVFVHANIPTDKILAALKKGHPDGWESQGIDYSIRFEGMEVGFADTVITGTVIK